MTQRWFHVLLRLFPASTGQHQRHAEMVEALADSDPNPRSVMRETHALVWASLIAWRLHLNTREGIRGSLYAGAVLWFCVLVGVGPVARFAGSLDEAGWYAGRSGSPRDFALAALVLLAVPLVSAWRRWPAALLCAAGLVVEAGANRVGDWGWSHSLPYELVWPGAAGVMVGVTWQRRRIGLAIVGVGSAVGVALSVMSLVGWPSTYGFTLQRWIRRMWSVAPAGRFSQWVVLIALVLLVVLATSLPWVLPGGVAFVAPALLHLVVLSLRLGRAHQEVILPLVYIVVVLALRWIIPRLDVSISFRSRDRQV